MSSLNDTIRKINVNLFTNIFKLEINNQKNLDNSFNLL